MLAGQTPTNLIANAVDTLLAHPGQLRRAARRRALCRRRGGADPLVRAAAADHAALRAARTSTLVRRTDRARVSRSPRRWRAANRDPRVFADPDRLDLRPARRRRRISAYAHGPHFCLGAPLARVQTEVALAALLRRFPDLSPSRPAARVPDPGTWRLSSLRVTIQGRPGQAASA